MNWVKEFFDYKEGQLFWKVINKKAGGIEPTNKRWRIKIKGKSYLRSRLIWFWHHGEWPKPFIDHINGNRRDDRIENLRIATRSLNNMNKRKQGKNPFKHIYKVEHKNSVWYNFAIRHEGKTKHIRLSKNLEELVIYRNKWLKENRPELLEVVHRFEGGK